MKFTYLSVIIPDFSISLQIESLERASAEFSVPFLYFISKSNGSLQHKTHLSILMEGFDIENKFKVMLYDQ